MVVEPTERPASVHAVRRLVLLIGATLAATAVWVPTSWAGAIVANYADGILTVTGNGRRRHGHDPLRGGDVTVNQAEPAGAGSRARICVASWCSPAGAATA